MATAPPLGYNTYFVRPATDQQCTTSTVTHPTTDTVISNDVSGSVTIATFSCAIVVVLQISSGWWEWPCQRYSQSGVRSHSYIRPTISVVLVQ